VNIDEPPKTEGKNGQLDEPPKAEQKWATYDHKKNHDHADTK
jgi:hypothetical protein